MQSLCSGSLMLSAFQPSGSEHTAPSMAVLSMQVTGVASTFPPGPGLRAHQEVVLICHLLLVAVTQMCTRVTELGCEQVCGSQR